ncbi:hypothetical protein RP20_CCG011864, partial [Aedes albopictus]
TPSITKVRPLISPTGLQITTRGRVVFNIVPVSQPLTEVVAAAMSTGSAAAAGENHPVLLPPSYVNLKSYLSPEYVNCLGKKPNFSESDVEKMWIYSLGVTLQKTISSFSVNYHQHQQKQHQQQQQLRNDADGRRSAAGTVTPTDEDGLTALDHVILAMCEANLYKRASLMFLLDEVLYESVQFLWKFFNEFLRKFLYEFILESLWELFREFLLPIGILGILPSELSGDILVKFLDRSSTITTDHGFVGAVSNEVDIYDQTVDDDDDHGTLAVRWSIATKIFPPMKGKTHFPLHQFSQFVLVHITEWFAVEGAATSQRKLPIRRFPAF